MSLSKAHLYSPADQLISFYSLFMIHPTRLDIVRDLNSNGPQNVHQIAIRHPLSLSAISQHLEILSERDLVNFNPQYPYLIYGVNRPKLDIAKSTIFNYLNSI